MGSNALIRNSRISVMFVSPDLRRVYAKAKALRRESEVYNLKTSTDNKSGEATKKILDAIQADLCELRHEEDDDGYVFKPSDYAFDTASDLVSEVYLRVSEDVPKPFVSPDGSGGVRLEWSRGSRIVSLVIPSSRDRQGYIYHRERDQHNAERDLSSGMLVTWLNWLIHG